MQNKTGSGNKGLDWVIVLGMLAAYPKTADLLSFWSPAFLNDLVGMDVSLLYGAFCALLVEGTVLFLHFDRRAHRVTSAQVVKWLLFGVSFACQVFDGFVTTETVSQMSDELKFALTYGIPALPLIISILITTIGALPDDETPQPRVGFKNRLPNIKAWWEGDPVENTRVSRNVQTSDETGNYDVTPISLHPEQDAIRNNGNPTSRRS